MRVLVIEDDEEMAEAVATGLRQAQMAVDVAFDGLGGFARAVNNEYEVIVIDRDLPGMHGDEICAELVSSGCRSRLLMLTAAATTDDLVDGLGMGADDYLTKPFSFDEFLARIRALLRRGPVTADVDLKIADLSLNLVSRTATRNGRKIELSSREFMLLEYFMRNPGAVLSRTRIYQHVWDYNFDGMTNVVDVYVNYLRKKIESGAEPKLLHTVRGHGYVLKPPE